MRTIVLLLCSQLALVSSYSFEQPVAKTVWHERCEKNSVALNDCNWCRCGSNHQFVCQARACREVDVFGHFNDAIKDIDVGMEGHGVWRSTASACEPGVHYHRDKLICVCGEDGTWPNPICRDIFQILHAVEVPKTDVKDECAPTKLYLIGCNVCFCPSTGRINSSLCTTQVCDDNDPVLEPNNKVETVDTQEDSKDLYAECETDLVYKLGCRTCTCLRNNRLVCGNCTGPVVNQNLNYCKNQPALTVFDVDCNMCYCDHNSNMVCSAKRCLGKAEASLRRFMDIDERYLELTETPLDDRNCRKGSKYKKGCNTCLCLENEVGAKMFACTTEPCSRSLFDKITKDCVMHTSFEVNCLKCQCVSANGRSWQWCETESRCSPTEAVVDRRDLDSLHGYCEPRHEYVKDCNKCQCLSEGQMLVCTDLICDKSPDPLEIDVVPLKQHGSCPKGHTYKIDCNICVCLKNGNALCTTMNCAKQTDAIKDIDVGMEGHGVWRSTASACEPGVHYHRDKLICVCGEDGTWPNPICRDIFQILHAVEVPKTDVKDECAPTKLYLIGCNVCFCPSTGRINSSLCTTQVCDDNDPVLEPNNKVETVDTQEDSKDLYAECETDLVYKLGCRTCTCLRNNRLVCGNCTGPVVNQNLNYCKNQPALTVFDVDCNMCYCDHNSNMVCSAKRCLGKAEASLRRFMDIDERYLELTETPLDDRNCRKGSKYKKGCNTCLCLENEVGAKMFACTTEPCSRSLFDKITKDCVMHTSFEVNCLKCQCVSANGRSWQWCETESRCSPTEAVVDRRDLDSLHGYCEPRHEYVKDCNKCQCLSEGQMLVCTDLICDKSPDPLEIDVVPLKQHGSCPKGHTYKIDCNICVCLKNGNALCTTMNCAKQTGKVLP